MARRESANAFAVEGIKDQDHDRKIEERENCHGMREQPA